MLAAAQRLSGKLGRRGSFLLLLGVAQVCFGLGYLGQSTPPPAGLGLLTGVADVQSWALAWIGCGAFTIACAWLRVGRDGLGYSVAMLPPLLWGASYLWSWASGEYARGLSLALWYAVGQIGVVMWAATVPEHSIPAPLKE